jgi:single-strand DNA-binding protein
MAYGSSTRIPIFANSYDAFQKGGERNMAGGGINKAIILGRLGKDPDMRYMTDGTAVANMSIATSDEWTDKNTGEKRKRTEWHKVVAFRRTGRDLWTVPDQGKASLYRGQNSDAGLWEDKDGNRRWITEIVAQEMQMLGSRADGDRSGGPPPPDAYPDHYIQAGTSGAKGGGGYDGGDAGFSGGGSGSSGSGGAAPSRDSGDGYPPPESDKGGTPEDDDDIPF